LLHHGCEKKASRTDVVGQNTLMIAACFGKLYFQVIWVVDIASEFTLYVCFEVEVADEAMSWAFELNTASSLILPAFVPYILAL